MAVFHETDVLTDELTDTIEKLVDQKHLVVHNDEVNTFDWVIQSLVEICNHNPLQAEQCSLLIHYKGKASVKEGELEELKPLKDGLTDRGLSATIE
ncbi:MAG: ATP-dependent Clp protease adaptor ClpS [Chitinophagales bacterium]